MVQTNIPPANPETGEKPSECLDALKERRWSSWTAILEQSEGTVADVGNLATIIKTEIVNECPQVSTFSKNAVAVAWANAIRSGVQIKGSLIEQITRIVFRMGAGAVGLVFIALGLWTILKGATAGETARQFGRAIGTAVKGGK